MCEESLMHYDAVQPGQLVISKAGHDKGSVYVVVKADSCTALVADGRLKTLDKPKRKNVKHLQKISQFLDDENGQRIEPAAFTDLTIKKVIKQYLTKRQK